MEPSQALLRNFTHDPSPHLGHVEQAVRDAIGTAMALRFASASLAGDWPGSWRRAWRGVLRRLSNVAAALPQSARLVSALGTSARIVLLKEVPDVVGPVLTGIATGKLSLSGAHRSVVNASSASLKHFESALILGEEALKHGSTRVSRAVYHRDIPFRDDFLHSVHRGDVLMAALTGGLGSASLSPNSSAPLLLELGVHNAELADRLLNQHHGLRWVGIDPYECEEPGLQAYRGFRSGPEVLRGARDLLRPFLGRRARFVVARSEDVTEPEIGGEAFDCVFVDGLHDQQSAFRDLSRYAAYARRGGLVAGHDYSLEFPGVVEAVHSLLPKGCTLHMGPDSVFWWLSGCADERSDEHAPLE
mmetsp:Transcript_123530/g.394598  ORF Transcript_123530/g.394598 Transcript_123530/m.394598 type:complete len:360 (+) Transcript_123530:65-1144(+)